MESFSRSTSVLDGCNLNPCTVHQHVQTCRATQGKTRRGREGRKRESGTHLFLWIEIHTTYCLAPHHIASLHIALYHIVSYHVTSYFRIRSSHTSHCSSCYSFFCCKAHPYCNQNHKNSLCRHIPMHDNSVSLSVEGIERTSNNDMLLLIMATQTAPCHNTSCHVMSQHIMSCHNTSCHVMSHHNTSCHVMSHHNTSCYVMSCHNTSCHVMSCQNIIDIMDT